MEERDPCISDILNLLQNYDQNLHEVLNHGVEATSEQSAERASEVTASEERAAGRFCAEDGMRVGEAQERYLSAVALENDGWFKSQAERADAHVAARKYELEVVSRHLSGIGCTKLKEEIHERCEQHLSLLAPDVEVGAANQQMQEKEAAKAEWTAEVCKAVLMDLRKDWRNGQKKVLQQLASELRAERKAAADALERQIMMSRKVSDAVKGMWSNELQQAQEELDQVGEAYKRALKHVLEAKLREARQHAKEQAEFFQKEIREALLFEQREHGVHQAQLRRMRLAMLKWRFDYQADARRKAAELVARSILAKLAAAGMTVSDAQLALMEEKKEARKQIKRDERAATKDAKKETYPGSSSKSSGNQERSALNRGSTGASSKNTSGVRFGDDAVEQESSNESSDVSSSDVSNVEMAEDWHCDQDLADSRSVLEKIWQRLPEEDEEPRDFMFRLEETIPYEEEILILYEEECARHGVASSLDATDGRAEGALQAEREAAAIAAAAESQGTLNEERKPKKKSVKPAVPVARRRANVEQ